jgi:copper resistance protein C
LLNFLSVPVPDRGCRRVLVGFALAVMAVQQSQAHAIIMSSEPAEGATVAAGPVTVTLRYNSRVDRTRSRVLLVGSDGRETPLTVVPEGDPAVLVAQAPALAPGGWRVRWQVLALDGHITRGDIRFTVAPR